MKNRKHGLLLKCIIGGLLLTAIGGALLLASKSNSNSILLACGGKAECGSILSSKWSHLSGIPVALIGVGLYVVLLSSNFLIRKRGRWLCFVEVCISMTIIFSALWFTFIQAVILQKFCFYCCIVHVIASVSSGLILYRVFKSSPTVALRGLPWALVFSLFVLSGIISIQTMDKSNGGSVIQEVSIQGGEALISPRVMTLLKTGVLESISEAAVDIDMQLPTIEIGGEGSTEGVVYLVLLYDWACEYCMELHHSLSKIAVENSLRSKYVITLLPAFSSDDGISVHRTMLTLYFNDNPRYQILKTLLEEGVIPPKNKDVVSMIIDLIGESEWSEYVLNTNELVEQVLLSSIAQMEISERVIGIATYPQLLSVNSALSGLPDDQKLEDFLLKAAEEQGSL